MGHSIDYIPPTAADSHQLIWSHLIGLDSIKKDIGEYFNGQELVNGATRRVDIMHKSRTPGWDGEQLV